VGIGADLFVCFLGQRRQIGLLQALVLDAQLDCDAEAAALTRADRNRAGDLGLGRVLLVLLAVRAAHEGVGLSRGWFTTAEKMGIEIRYGAAVTAILQDDRGHASGVRVRDDGGVADVHGRAVILGCGGFEANVQMRTQHIGPLVGGAKVRGTPHNQGDGLRMAMAIGAMPWGQWSGCHATPISADWGNFAPRELTDRSNRLSYLYGVMINRRGRRFVDEGEDGAMFTYAKYGRAILAEPGAKAYQIFDAQVVHLLEPRYATSEPITANTLEDLVAQLDIRRSSQFPNTGSWPTRVRNGEGFGDPLADETSATTS
jgi:tricarballylate dehydrogenase